MKSTLCLLLILKLSSAFAMNEGFSLSHFRCKTVKDTVPFALTRQFLDPQYCDAFILLNSPESRHQFTYNAKNTITTESAYSVGMTNHQIVMKAGSAVVLKPRTHIKNGSLYLARIEPCAECTIDITYPVFFTPNADYYNDVWRINWKSHYPGSKVEIFDRFGKLIKTLTSENDFWDGKHIGKDVFSNDYWFKFKYRDCNGIPHEYK